MGIDENAYNTSSFIGAVWRRLSKGGKTYYTGNMRNPNDLTDNGEFPVIMFPCNSENKKAPAFVFKKTIGKAEFMEGLE